MVSSLRFLSIASTLLLTFACSSGDPKICGANSVNLNGTECKLSISVINHGTKWRVVNNFSKNNVKVDLNKFHVTNDGYILGVRPLDEWNHPIFTEGEITLNHNILYFDVYKDDYKKGDKIEFIFDKNYIDGSSYTNCLLTEQ